MDWSITDGGGKQLAWLYPTLTKSNFLVGMLKSDNCLLDITLYLYFM